MEDRGRWFALLLAVDDATGRVPYGVFHEREDTLGAVELLKGIITRNGIPLGVYIDRHSWHIAMFDSGQRTFLWVIAGLP